MSEPVGVRSVCADCLTHPRLHGLLTGSLTLVAVRERGPPERCVFCGFPLAAERGPPGRGPPQDPP